MVNIAAIDIGSNAMRMVVGAMNGQGQPRAIENIREAVRLGGDVFTRGSISDATMERSVEAFNRFRKLLYKHEVKHSRAVATSALREAANREMFIDRIAQASNIGIEVIPGEEEARLIHLAVSRNINLKNKLAVLVDIGGGSVEITLASGEEILASESFNMGTVRLLQKFDETKMGGSRFNQLVREYVDAAKKRIKQEIGSRKIDLCIGTGGNVEALGDLRNGLFKKNHDRVTRDVMESLIQKLQGMTVEERVQKLGLRPDRADVIMPAAIILQKLMKLADVDELQVPCVGLKDGVLIDLAEGMASGGRVIHREQVMNSALQIGRQYKFDEPHGAATAKFAAKLFDELRELHHLPDDSRILLEVAAMLHDIGKIVNITGHHKHSYYLITNSPLRGLSDPQREIVANVARYHRKSSPTLEHEPFKGLSSKDRVLVTKLSALMRLADALDTEHADRVADVAVEYKKPRLLVKLKGEGDMLLEKWRITKCAPFFEEVFGVQLVLHE